MANENVIKYVATANLLDFIATAVNNIGPLAKQGGNPIAVMSALAGTLPKAIAAVSNLRDLPAEFKTLSAEATDELLADFADKVQLSSDKARRILLAFLKLVSNVRDDIADVRALLVELKPSDAIEARNVEGDEDAFAKARALISAVAGEAK